MAVGPARWASRTPIGMIATQPQARAGVEPPVILTATLNAALDITYRVPRLTPHTSHRVRDVAERPSDLPRITVGPHVQEPTP